MTRISPALNAALEAEAHRIDRTKSDMVRRILEKHYRRLRRTVTP